MSDPLVITAPDGYTLPDSVLDVPQASWPIDYAGQTALTCDTCAGLVLYTSADDHLAWHVTRGDITPE